MKTLEPAERVTIASAPKNQREVLKIEAYRMPDGKWRYGARIWFRDGEEWKPSREGWSLPIETASEVALAFHAVVQAARDRELIE